MPEGGLKREYVHAPLHSVCGMALPQLVWVNVEPGGASPLPANISNCLACEMPIPPGTREDEIFRIAAAQLLKESKRCWRYANSSPLGSFAEKVDLPSAIENLDVSPTDSRDLRDPASEQIRTFDQGVIALGVAIKMSGPGDGRHQQPELLWS